MTETIVKIGDKPQISALTGTVKFPVDDGSDGKHALTSQIPTYLAGEGTLATVTYVNGIAANLGKRARVRAATTANITISTALNNADTLDGVTLVTGDLVLVKNQSSAAQNGVYVVGASPARFAEFDTYDKHPGSLIAVEEGTSNADTTWLCTSNVGGTLGTTAITFNASGNGSISVQEQDGTPNVAGVTTIKVTNGTLTDEGGGVVSLDLGGAGGSDLVKVTAGIGTVTVPGFAGSPDKMPASPGAADDEFDTLSGWTVLGTLDTSTISDFPSHWHVKRTNAGVGVDGIYKAAPSMPFTVTAKLADSNVAGGPNYNFAGILLTESSPGKVTTFGLVSNSAVFYASIYRFTNRTTLATNIDTSLGASNLYANPFPYLRLVVASSSDISAYVSHEGFIWFPVTSQQNVTSGLTIANVGLAIGDAATAGTVEAVFDWIRFT